MAKTPTKLRILFVDKMNDVTSQLAEYFTRKMFGDRYDVFSAGPEHDIIDCELISVMYQRGDDMRRQTSKDFRDQETLPADAKFDLVIYLDREVFDEWSTKTPWKGIQIYMDMPSTKDFDATDDAELFQCYMGLIGKIEGWVKESMGDVESLRPMVTA